MTLSKPELELWNRVEDFSLDDDSASFSFTQRLAKENN